MVRKKNINFTLGMNREELKKLARELGMKSDIGRQSTKRLENFIRNNYPIDLPSSIPKNQIKKRKINTDFRLGIEREELKQLAKDLGMKSDVNRTSTERLENYIKNQLGGKGKELDLDDNIKRDIQSLFEVGYSQGKGYLSQKLGRVFGVTSSNALRIEVERQFSVFYNDYINNEMLTELMNRLEYRYEGEAFNKLINTFEYMDIFRGYAEELRGER